MTCFNNNVLLQIFPQFRQKWGIFQWNGKITFINFPYFFHIPVMGSSLSFSTLSLETRNIYTPRTFALPTFLISWAPNIINSHSDADGSQDVTRDVVVCRPSGSLAPYWSRQTRSSPRWAPSAPSWRRGLSGCRAGWRPSSWTWRVIIRGNRKYVSIIR